MNFLSTEPQRTAGLPSSIFARLGIQQLSRTRINGDCARAKCPSAESGFVSIDIIDIT